VPERKKRIESEHVREYQECSRPDPPRPRRLVALQETLMSWHRVVGRTPLRSNRFQSIPSVQGEDAQQASSVYHDFYGELPIPATAYATSSTALRSVDPPAIVTVQAGASIVSRANRRDGLIATGGRQSREEVLPETGKTVRSSDFQDWLIGPQVQYDINKGWYIAYPAATVMLGGMHNLALSERVPQLPTRISGGPGPGTMRQAPRFKAVQQVPRYSTMPPHYSTTTTPG